MVRMVVVLPGLRPPFSWQASGHESVRKLASSENGLIIAATLKLFRTTLATVTFASLFLETDCVWWGIVFEFMLILFRSRLRRKSCGICKLDQSLFPLSKTHCAHWTLASFAIKVCLNISELFRVLFSKVKARHIVEKHSHFRYKTVVILSTVEQNPLCSALRVLIWRPKRQKCEKLFEKCCSQLWNVSAGT